MATEEDLMKLKVVELRGLLAERGLDQKGVKAVLVQRLLENQSDGERSGSGGSGGVMDAEEDNDGNEVEEDNAQVGGENDALVKQVEEDNQQISEAEEATEDLKDTPTKDATSEPEKTTSDPAAASASVDDSCADLKTSDDGGGDFQGGDQVNGKPEAPKAKKQANDADGVATAKKKEEAVTTESSEPEAKESRSDALTKEKEEEETYGPKEPEAKSKGEDDLRGEKRKRSRSRSHSRGRSRRRTRSPSRSSRRSQSTKERADKGKDLVDPVGLDSFECDLNLAIHKVRRNTPGVYEAYPVSHHGAFAWMWGAVRGTHGALKGKCYFEIKITAKKDNVKTLEGDPVPHLIRVGELQLGRWTVSS
ncbi:unnamed protein product, partial [Cyprideis torosa]